MVKTEKKYSLKGCIVNAAWIEEHAPVGEVFDHLTQLYTLVYEGMSPVHPEFRDFSFDHIEMVLSDTYKNKLTEALLETKRMVDNYMVRENFPCFMEFAG